MHFCSAKNLVLIGKVGVYENDTTIWKVLGLHRHCAFVKIPPAPRP